MVPYNYNPVIHALIPDVGILNNLPKEYDVVIDGLESQSG